MLIIVTIIPNLNIGENASSRYPIIINNIPIIPIYKPIEISTVNITGNNPIIVPIIVTTLIFSFSFTKNLFIKNVAYNINKL